MVKWGKLKYYRLRKHRNEAEVKELKDMPKAFQWDVMQKLRKEGCHKYNKTAYGSKELMRERKPKTPDPIRMGSVCTGYYSSRNFYKHKQDCQGAEPVRLSDVNLKSGSYYKDKTFSEMLLGRFLDDPVGNLCRQSDVIKEIGYRHFCQRQHDKTKLAAVKKNVMTEMRPLGRLFMAVNDVKKREFTGGTNRCNSCRNVYKTKLTSND